jgi:hypothetical protein
MSDYKGQFLSDAMKHKIQQDPRSAFTFDGCLTVEETGNDVPQGQKNLVLGNIKYSQEDDVFRDASVKLFVDPKGDSMLQIVVVLFRIEIDSLTQ